MLTNQVINESIRSILQRSISDVDKAKAILSFMNSNGVEIWQIGNATGFTEDQIRSYLALATPAAPVDLPIFQNAGYSSSVDLYNLPAAGRVTPEGVITGGGWGWERGPGTSLSYDYIHRGTPLAFNQTLADRLYYTYLNAAERELATKIFYIIGRAAQTGTNPSAALEAINAQYDGFASRLIADIGLGGQMRAYTGNANFYGAGPTADVQREIDRPRGDLNPRQLEIYATLPDGTPTPTGPPVVSTKPVVRTPVVPANQPPVRPGDVITVTSRPGTSVPVGPTTLTPTPVTPVPVTPTPESATTSNLLPLALAAVAFYLLG